MDSQQFDKMKALTSWLSRRGLVKGLAAMAAGAAIGRGTARAQVGTEPTPADAVQPTTDPYAPTDQMPPTEASLPTDTPWPTETPWATETPTPAETPWATETPAPTPTETPMAPTEPPPPSGPIVQIDDRRSQIAELCKQAADVLAEDVADPKAFEGHPHPDEAYGFLQMLNGVAMWGTNAQSWDDAMLANYVVAADACALGIRIGADAYYEMIKDSFPAGAFPADPDTCIFEEIRKYEEAIAQCAPDDALCRMTAFWNFTVLNSCRRCLRAF